MGSNKHFLAEVEEQLLATWEKEKTFQKSLENRKGSKLFSFYDGPPFANGVPHYGHLVQTTIKDTVTRYKTMQGYYVPRRVGWDTHGLPVEYAIEKEHEFRGKQDIVAYGIDKFNAECRESVFKYKDVWEKMFRRVGRWADYDQTYATLDESYIESVWWVFKTIYDKGLVYKDFRSSPYCPRCATPLSNFELNQGYQDNVSDPSLFVKFKLTDESVRKIGLPVQQGYSLDAAQGGQEERVSRTNGTVNERLTSADTAMRQEEQRAGGPASRQAASAVFLLAWTTTPWSLPGNAAIAVKPDAKYVYVEVTDDNGRPETLVLARERLEALNVDTYHIVKELEGRELVGLGYEPLFNLSNLNTYENTDNLYKVWPAEFVSIEDGSGVLHVAPAFGEDDLNLGKENSIPVLLTIDEFGKTVKNIGLPEEIEGQFFKKADNKIIEHLAKEDLVYAAETLTHTYPFCWRCDTPLLYYATDSWLVKVTAVNEKLIKNNKKVNWTPGHIRDGRFGKWLEGARDWAISRNRFWGAPLPVWVTEDGETVVVSSVAELKKLAKDPAKVTDLHRPFIDDVEITTPSGKTARRIPEVFDCWFESGSMPYAQDHYPFENSEDWGDRYPADFIAEAIDQTRGWFYTLHVLATALFDKPAFKNVICSGWVVAADGEKLSKRKKNYAPMDEVFDQFGVDTLRFFMASSPIVNGEDVRFSVDYLRDVQRKVFMTLNNTFNFYKLYADVDKWQPKTGLNEPKSTNILDKWIIARVNEAVAETTTSLDKYRLDKATKPLIDLLDDVSNWFVRRSRRRFWKSEDDDDKQQAYETLYFTLIRLCQLLAPFSPFLSDHLWRQLVEGTELPVSVHLSDWPEAGKIDKPLLDEMKQVRDTITEGLALRAEAKIKVRQPLAEAVVPKVPEQFKDVIADELNVKKVAWGSVIKIDTKLTKELVEEGYAREIIRQVQNARKLAGLEVDDRIDLVIGTSDQKLQEALKSQESVIKQETLAKSLNKVDVKGFEKEVKIEGAQVVIRLAKAS